MTSSNEKYRGKYRIPSARAGWHDYNGGAYFITVCTQKHRHYFGEIPVAQMELTPIGRYLSENLVGAAHHYPYAEIPWFVVMPNHWHAIMVIDYAKIPNRHRRCRDATRRDGARPVSTTGITINEKMRQTDADKGWLSVVVGGIKSAVTRFAHANHLALAWQTRFHDHIIREQEEYNRIADYVNNNPANWQTDCFYNPLP